MLVSLKSNHLTFELTPAGCESTSSQSIASRQEKLTVKPWYNSGAVTQSLGG